MTNRKIIIIGAGIGGIEEETVFRISFAAERYPAGADRQVLDFVALARRMKAVSFVSSIESSLVSAAEAVSRVCGWGGTI
jgi:hypothetical protein